MTVQTTSRRRRVVAAAGVVAIGLGSMLGATAAQAAPEFGNVDIDTDRTGSIIVHKHENQTGSNPVIGDPDGGSILPNPIAGAGFTAYTLTGIDLRTNQGWADVNKAVASLDAAGVCDATLDGASIKGSVAATETTGANGEATLGNLLVGAYLVCETTVPSNVATPAAPFIVTVPFPDNQATAPSNTNGWLYNVHVYPKNTLKTTVTKSIDEQGEFGLGSTVTFPITATVPRIPEENRFTQFSIVDDMAANFTDMKVESVKVGSTDVLPTYYTKSADGTNPVSVAFNLAGLEWLKTQAGETVTVTVSGVVSSVPADGNIDNKATVRVSHEPDDPTDPPVEPPVDPPAECDPEEEDCEETPTVTTTWGDLKLEKVDADNTDSTLAGATFVVYEATPAYAADCSTTTRGDAVTIAGAPFVSDADGIVTIPGLYVADSVNNPGQSARCYWLEETEAPAGFVVPSDPFTAVSVTAGLTSDAYDYQVENTKTSVPELPLTGAAGQTLLITGGIALLMIGTVLFTVRRRQAHQS